MPSTHGPHMFTWLLVMLGTTLIRPGAIAAQGPGQQAPYQATCTVVRADPGAVLLNCPGAPPTSHMPAIVPEQWAYGGPCMAKVGDVVLAIVGPHQLIVIRNTTAVAGTRCVGYYKVAVEGGCKNEYYCKARDSWERIECARCGWIETYYCDGDLKERSSGSCTLCDGRVIPGVVRGPDEGWGDGIPWEQVQGRRYIDKCGLPPTEPPQSALYPDDLADFADHLRQVFDVYRTADGPVGAEAQAQAAQAHDLSLYRYLTGLGVMRKAGRSVAFVKRKLAEIEVDLTRAKEGSSKRRRLERQREAWLEWTTPERLELLAENPEALPELAVAIETSTAYSAAELEKLPPDLRESLAAVAGPMPIPEALRGAPGPGLPRAADAAFLWRRWSDFEAMVMLLLYEG